jgi:hypothetical protein
MFAVATAGVQPQAHPEEAKAVKVSPDRHRSVAPARTPEVSASDLWMSYSRDPAAADLLYREHPLWVTGDVHALERNYEGGMVVRLSAGNGFDTVNATLATRNDPVAGTLAKGVAVSLLCVGRGALMGAPLLGSCFVR